MLAVETSQLTKYYGKARGIQDVSLSVEDGEIFGFIGPNGAGKTTTIRTLLSLIRPTRGKARIFGMAVKPGGGELHRLVGYVPSEVRYYPEMTGKDLLDYAASFHSRVDVSWVKALEERLNFDPSRRFRNYSHGNRKKLGVIQALMHRPRLLILDEVTSGLDPLIRLELFQILQELNREGVTVFFSTHVLEEIERICDRVGVIREGRLIQVSTVDELPGRKMRIITFRTTGGKNPGDTLSDLGRAEPVEGKPGYYRLAADAPPNEILSAVGRLELEHIKIADPTVEELFLEMYHQNGNGEGA